MKILNAKTDISLFINVRYLRLNMLKNNENNKKICDIFHNNFKNIPCYLTSEVSLKRFCFVLFDDGQVTLTILNWRISVFAFKLFKYKLKKPL